MGWCLRCLVVMVCALTVGAVVALAGSPLISCPDCGGAVSRRAVMCPACGCPGEAIVEAVEREAAEAMAPQAVVAIRTSERDGWGLLVRDAGRTAVVLDAALLYGVDALTVYTCPTNAAILYRGLQVAMHLPLVRLEVEATNLPALAVSEGDPWGGAQGFWWQPSCERSPLCLPASTAADGTVALPPVDANAVSLLDGGTNLIGLLVGRGGDRWLARLAEAGCWVPVQPGVFRSQTGLLREADAQAVGGVPSMALRAALEQTAWLTPYFSNRAERLMDSWPENKEVAE